MNVELPTFGRHQIFSLPMDNDMNPYRKEHYDASATGWTLTVDRDVNLVPDEERKYKECAHADRCAAWTSEGTASGWITFRLPRMDRGRIVVCAKGKAGGQALLDDDVQFYFNDMLLTPTGDNVVYGKCLEVMSEFVGGVNDGLGHCHLGVVSSTSIAISHVISQ
jgi:hypothetical protein